MPDTLASPLLSPQLLAQLERLELVSRKIFRGRMKGERKSKRKGQSVEFADFRQYVPGDDLRFIDWNLFARMERLYLKLFLEEEDLHFYALIDTSGSMDFGEPTAAIRQAARGVARVHRPLPGGSREDRDARHLQPQTGTGAPRQVEPVADDGLSGGNRGGRKRLADRRRQKLLPAELGQGTPGADQRPDGGGTQGPRLVAQQMDVT
jgi:hypothetical protein